MARKLPALILLFIVITVTGTRREAAGLGFAGTGLGWRSIDCTSIVTGISKPELANLNIACTANVREIVRSCRNKGGNAGGANAEKFQVTADPIEAVDLGSGLKVDRQGKATSNVVISNQAIRDHLGPILDPKVVCGVGSNNFIVDFAVTQLDVVIELLSGASEPPNQDNTCQVVSVSLDPATACTPGTDATCQQVECMYFRHSTPSTPTLIRNTFTDTTVCQKPNATFDPENYDCTCDLDGDPVNGYVSPCPPKIKNLNP